MRTVNFLSAAAILAATILASCSRSDEPAAGNDRVEVRFSAGAAEIQTRVTDNRWAANDPVGIYMIGASGTLETDNIVEDAGNRQYQAAADGEAAVSFTSQPGEAIYYPMSGNVEFIAYYPYAPSVPSDFLLPVSVATQTDQSTIDVLYAKTTGNYNKSTAAPVPLAFEHKLVKLVFNITRGDGVAESLDDLTVKITGQETASTLNLTDGTIAAATGGPKNITAKETANHTSSANYEAIVLPNSNVSGMTFTFTTAGTGGGTYEAAVPAGSWEPGKKYTYGVTLKRDEVEITGSGGSNWTEGSAYDITGVPEQYIVETVFIPKGTFLMGSPGSEPGRSSNETQHSVTLTRDYRMSKYEITNAQYAKFLNDEGIGSSGVKAGIQDGKQLIQSSSETTGYDWGLHYNADQWEPVTGYADHPVIYVSWYGAKAYAEWAGGDLPTEAQWERAARGGGDANMPFGIGDGTSLTSAMANFGSSVGKTTAAGAYSDYANAYGLYDMHGNVMEWCLDWYNSNYYATSPNTDPEGASPGSSRVLRGGDWIYDARYCRSACRDYGNPGFRSFYVGFRVVFYP